MALPVPPPPNVIAPSAPIVPPPNVVAPAAVPPNVVVQKVAEGVSGKARKMPAPRSPEVAPEFYSKGHMAWFDLPKEARATFNGTVRSRLSKGFLPAAEAIFALDSLGIPFASFRTPSERKTSEGPVRIYNPNPFGGLAPRPSLFDTSTAGAAIKAVWPEVSYKDLAGTLDVSVEDARACLTYASTPPIHGARALEARFPALTIGMWQVTAEGKEARAAKVKARKERQEKKAADAAQLALPAVAASPVS